MRTDPESWRSIQPECKTMFPVNQTPTTESRPGPGPRRGCGRTVPALVALAGLVVLCVAGAAAQTAQLSFDPPTAEFTCGETLYVDVRLDGVGVGDLAGFSLVLAFDDAVLAPVDVSAGDLLGDAACPHFFTWLNVAAVGDSITVDGALLGCTTPLNGPVVRLAFVGAAYGQGVVSCRRGEMRDGLNGTIPFSSGEGLYDSTCTTSAEPAGWGEVKALYR
jgi:hypothetical protein